MELISMRLSASDTPSSFWMPRWADKYQVPIKAATRDARVSQTLQFQIRLQCSRIFQFSDLQVISVGAVR